MKIHEEKDFYFGISERDITPVNATWLDGYCARKEKTGAVKEPLSLGCIAIAVGNKKILFITCDNLGIEDQFCREIFHIIEKEFSIPRADIILSCSHTHFAPTLRNDGFAGASGYFVKPDPIYWADFKNKLTEAVKESLANLRSGWIESVRISVPQVHYNRRTRRPDGTVATNFIYPNNESEVKLMPVDSELTALRFRDNNGIKAVLVNFACHPVVGWGVKNVSEDMVSSDYPYYLREKIRNHYACPVLFSLGGAGDVVPVERLGNIRQEIGSILGSSLIISERKFKKNKNPEIKTDLISFTIDIADSQKYSDVEKEFHKLLKMYGPRFWDAKNQDGTCFYGSPGWNQKFTSVLANTYQRRIYPENKYSVPINFMKIGEIVIVSLPFEVLSEIVLKIKEKYPQCILVSCANGYQGYLPLKHEFKRGGYEVSRQAMHFAQDSGDRILKSIMNKLKSF